MELNNFRITVNAFLINIDIYQLQFVANRDTRCSERFLVSLLYASSKPPESPQWSTLVSRFTIMEVIHPCTTTTDWFTRICMCTLNLYD